MDERNYGLPVSQPLKNKGKTAAAVVYGNIFGPGGNVSYIRRDTK
ncbi:hypothetical protein GGR26_002218 [Lewinella marina]|nr:hypothetical protein [Neolewinella marina]